MPDPVAGNQGMEGGAGAGGSAGTDGAGAGGGTAFVFDDNAIASLPEDIRGEASLGAFKGKGIADIARSFVNAQRMVGAEKIALPKGALDTDEQWSQVWDRLGRPKDPEGYRLDRPQLPDGLAYDEGLEKTFRQIFHRAGLTDKQATVLYQAYNQAMVGKYQDMAGQHARQVQEASDALKKEWGADYDKNLLLANKVLHAYGGGKEQIEAFSERFGNDPVAIKIFAAIGKEMSEDKLAKGEPGSSRFGESPQSAKSKALDIMTNKENPLYEAYHKRDHIRHREAVEKVEGLFQIAKGADAVKPI